MQPIESVGKVYLVGAGPGHPGLLTLRGAECLGRADVVLYDYLVNPRVLEHTPASAEIQCLGQHGLSRLWTQLEINTRMIALARDGKTVVRLKGGDPTVFARAVDELSALSEAGIPFEIVPGVTAGIAAASYAGITLTHREHASAVALVTGQEDAEKDAPGMDYAALASFPGTLVFYMGITTAHRWSSQLLAAGKPPETPVAVVRHCSLPDQVVLRCTLAELADRLAEPPRIRPPAVVIVGTVVQASTISSWFQHRPLFGQKIVVTRPREQAGQLAHLLDEQGADVLIQPAIEIRPPPDWSLVDRALARLQDFDWLVFSSANGVRSLLQRLRESGRDLRALGGLKLAAIGPGTADALSEFHLTPDLRPEVFRAETLADALVARGEGQRFLLARASRGREVLSERLQQSGATVEQVIVYQSFDVVSADPQIARGMAAGTVDWVTVTSSAIANSLVRMFGPQLRQSKLASISPITTATLQGLGFEVAVEAAEYTMAGIVHAILRHQEQTSSS